MDATERSTERYGLSWVGRAEAERAAAEPPTGRLVAQPADSLRFEETENRIIEGENLAALKLLAAATPASVRMIYIDPPYNTGRRFVYPDDYRQPLEDYVRGETGDDRPDGRLHSQWLSMMYPRLVLARRLLRDDGVIFVSIDDTEHANLVLLMNEIFGEEHSLGTIIWQHGVQPKGYTGTLSVHHSPIVCYRRTDRFKLAALPRKASHNRRYANRDGDPRGPWRTGDVRNALHRPNLIYDIETPSGRVIEPPANGWRWSRETLEKKIASGEIVFSDDETRIIRKIHLANVKGRAAESIWFARDVGTTREAVRELKALFDGACPFDTPKPTRLVRRMLQVAGVKDDDVVLDFFAGSGTTAHAVIAQNAEDGGRRRFVLVQMADAVAAPGESKHSSIADITRERVRRAIEGAGAEAGFRAYRLQHV